MKKILYLLAFVSIISCSKDEEAPSFEEQLAIDLAIIDNYLLEEGIEAQEHSSGIRFINTVVGDGASPLKGERASIKIKFSLLNEVVVFEDTIGLTASLSDPTISALQLMIPEMKTGGEMKLFAPSGLCFGAISATGIPANSNLIFTIELLDVIKNEDDQLLAENKILDEFLAESEIEALLHESGIRYTVQNEGTGESPTSGDAINVSYKGTFLNGLVFDQNEDGIEFPLTNLIEAWKIMIPTMKVGGEITFYAPSKFCYSTTGNGSIPPNTTLVFEIKLIDIK